MKVCIFGAGAIGGHLAARLAAGGADVSVVARGAQLDAIRRNGITVRAPDGELTATMRASDSPAELGAQDVVIVCVKATALTAIATTIAPLLTPETEVIFVNNGIPWWYFHGVGGAAEGQRLPLLDPDGGIWRAIDPSRVVGGVIYSACTVTEPGVIDVKSPRNHLILGTPDARPSPAADAIVATLTEGGMTGAVTPRIRDDIWSKLLVNLSMGPIAVLAGCPQGLALQQPACSNALRQILDEAARIAVAFGARPDYSADRQLSTIGKLMHKPSLLQDLEQGRPMEIDAVLQTPLDLARQAGVDTPVLDLLVTLVKLRASAAGCYR